MLMEGKQRIRQHKIFTEVENILETLVRRSVSRSMEEDGEIVPPILPMY